VTDRYLKVSHRYTDAAYTFVLDDPRSDIAVEFAATECDRTISGAVSAPVTINGDGTNCIDGATIAAPVTIGDGASVVVRDSRISAPISSDQAAMISICDSTISGRVTISGSTGPVLIGPRLMELADDHGCRPNTISGPLSLD